MSSPPSPVVAAWELALRLRRRRDEMGVEVKAITQALGFTRNYWSMVENERKILTEENLVKLLDLLEFDQEEQRELLELRRIAKERGWWTRYSALIDGELQRLIGLEAGADRIRWYESILIPGLLQTADYARANMTPDATVRQVEIDQRVEIRLRRQLRLTDDDPLSMTAIVSEAALRQEIGGPAVLRGQLEHVAAMIERHPDRIEFRVIPFTATACGLFGAATVQLIDFANPMLQTVVWQETVTTHSVIEDPYQVRDIVITYNVALERTLNVQDSLDLIRQRIEELT